MLALKSIFVKSRGQTAILFDEVDFRCIWTSCTKMAEKMRDIAEYIQVICISHLPQSCIDERPSFINFEIIKR